MILSCIEDSSTIIFWANVPRLDRYHNRERYKHEETIKSKLMLSLFGVHLVVFM